MDSNEGIVATSEILAAFQSKIEAKTAQVGIIGLGYVGLPLALLLLETDSRCEALTSIPPR